MSSSFRSCNYFLTRVHELHFIKELTTYDQVYELKSCPDPFFFSWPVVQKKKMLNEADGRGDAYYQ